MIAIVRMLKPAGHDAVATADVNALGKLDFLEGAGDLLPVRRLRRQRRFDLLVAVDCGSFERMPPEVRPVAEKLPKVCIDHHVTNDGAFADASIIDPTASSAGKSYGGSRNGANGRSTAPARRRCGWRSSQIPAGSHTTPRAQAPCAPQATC